MFKLKKKEKKEKKNRFGWLKDFLSDVFYDDMEYLFMKLILGALITVIAGLVLLVIGLIAMEAPIIFVFILLGIFVSMIVGHFIMEIF